MYHSMRTNCITGKKDETILLVLMTFLYVSFYLPMGSSIPTLLLLGYYLIRNRLQITFEISIFVIYCCSFVIFCYLSCLWARDTYYVLLYSNHIIKSIFGIMVVYLCVFKKQSIDLLLKTMVAGGYIIMVYMIAFYGIDGIIRMINASERLTNDVMNANQFAMCISYSCVIHIFYGLKDRWNISHLLIIPALFLLAVSGSRKGLLVLACGVIFLSVLTIWLRERSVKSLLKIVLWMLAIGAGIVLILNIPAFRMVKERIQNFFSLLLGEPNADNSLLTRLNFIDVGISIFKDHPILGVGIDNARLYNYRNVYLHNNFVEMLADGGLIGFCLYYSLYIYLLVEYIRRRKNQDDYYAICFILLVLMIAMHYAFVAYKVSGEYYMLLLCYLQLKQNQTSDNYSGLGKTAENKTDDSRKEIS